VENLPILDEELAENHFDPENQFSHDLAIMHILVYQMVSRSTNIRSTNPQIDPDIISLQVNIDGIPLYKSSSTQVWPILASLEGLTPLSLECLLGIISYQM